MQTREIALGLAAATVIVTAGLVLLLARAPSEEPPLAAPSNEPLTIAVSDPPAQRVIVPALAHDAPAAVKIRELEAMSETYRNTTFVIAIRDAGYTCNELLRVYGGIDNSGKWTATCSEMLAYTVGVTSIGTLHVDPLLQYFDAQWGVRIDQSGPNTIPSGRTLRDSLPPETR
jgi:hypothetical protein